jgi:hypothetical protein
LTNRQRTAVEKKMIVFVIDALAVLYAVEEMGEARLTAACDHDTYVNRLVTAVQDRKQDHHN